MADALGIVFLPDMQLPSSNLAAEHLVDNITMASSANEQSAVSQLRTPEWDLDIDPALEDDSQSTDTPPSLQHSETPPSQLEEADKAPQPSHGMTTRRAARKVSPPTPDSSNQHVRVAQFYRVDSTTQEQPSRKRNTSSTKTSPKRQRKSAPVNAQEEAEEARRKENLQRNRVAASKCRQKKKEAQVQLEAREKEEKNKNIQLHALRAALVEEAASYKSKLMDHATCHDLNIDKWIDQEARHFVERNTNAEMQAMQAHSAPDAERRFSYQSMNDASSIGTDRRPSVASIMEVAPVNADGSSAEMAEFSSPSPVVNAEPISPAFNPNSPGFFNAQTSFDPRPSIFEAGQSHFNPAKVDPNNTAFGSFSPTVKTEESNMNYDFMGDELFQADYDV